jgi:tetratricopeptide (TPR) repeat protein
LLIARVETQTELLVTAHAAQRGGDFETSYVAFSRAGAAGPLAVYDLDAMATAAGRMGHGREAMRVGELVYIRLTRTDPHAAAGKAVELGAAWLSRGEWVAGQMWIKRARSLFAGTADSPASRRLADLDAVAVAFAAYASTRSAIARSDLRAAIASSAGDGPRLLRGAAQIALAAGDLDEAEHYLRELDSVAAEDSVLRGAMLVRRGRYHEALTVLQAALRQPGYETGEVYDWINEAYRGQGATGR